MHQSEKFIMERKGSPAQPSDSISDSVTSPTQSSTHPLTFRHFILLFVFTGLNHIKDPRRVLSYSSDFAQLYYNSLFATCSLLSSSIDSDTVFYSVHG